MASPSPANGGKQEVDGPWRGSGGEGRERKGREGALRVVPDSRQLPPWRWRALELEIPGPAAARQLDLTTRPSQCGE